MSTRSVLLPTAQATQANRRAFLRGAGTATLSATAIALLAGCSTSAEAGPTKAAGSAQQDVSILNTALGLEHEAITAYQLGAESGLLQKPVLAVAVQFQSHHKAHRDALTDAILKMGGKPVEAKSTADYAAALNAAALKNQTDVLRLAANLERGAANAYIGAIPSFSGTGLAQVAARLAADETMHWTALAGVLGDKLPTSALSFGA
jgi:rubrerythrin